jgi:hypothetical protein
MKISYLWNRFDQQAREYVQFPSGLHRLRKAEKRISRGFRQRTDDRTIISLTTHPQRIRSVYLTLRSLLAQEVLPRRIFLVVARDEFPCQRLPEKLVALTDDRVEIVEIERTRRSYNKIIPALERCPDFNIVTCDDDKIYEPDWLSSLTDAARFDTGTIICHCARELPLYRSTQYPPYREWHHLSENVLSMNILPLGVGGVLYPAGSLHKDCARADLFEKLAPFADDLWLRFMSLRMGVPVRRLARYEHMPTSIPTSWSHRLSHRNIRGNENVATFKRLLATYCDELRRLGVLPTDTVLNN